MYKSNKEYLRSVASHASHASPGERQYANGMLAMLELAESLSMFFAVSRAFYLCLLMAIPVSVAAFVVRRYRPRAPKEK